MNCIDYFYDDKLATKVFYFTIAIAFILIGYAERKRSKFYQLFYYLAWYHLLDEILETACVFNWYEISGAILTIIYVAYNTKSSNNDN